MARIDNVNIFQGTASDMRLSVGNTYPAVARPWGMTYWSPQTSKGPWIYTPPLSERGVYLEGIRATHQSSPWMGDYGHLTLQPISGPVREHIGDRGSLVRPDELSADPSRIGGFLRAWDVRFELTATERAAAMSLTYEGHRAPGLAVGLFSEDCEAHYDEASNQIVACSRYMAKRERGEPLESFGCWYVIEADVPMVHEPRDDGLLGIVVRFPGREGKAVNLRIGTSFISADQARLNMRQELAEKSLGALIDESRDAWNNELGRIDIGGASDEVQRTFYSCLYRMLLFPRSLHEYNNAGEPIHWSPYTENIEPGTMVTDHGFWDTFRTVYPLLAVVWPKKYGELLDAWVRCYEQSGWLPRWASPGHRACMVGNHLAPVIADAAVKGIEGFDLELAYEGIKKDGTVPGDEQGLWGRQQLPAYHALGYLPDDQDVDSVARTQDYTYNDWCVAVVAQLLGKDEDAALFGERANGWKHIFDEQTQFLRGKNADGSWAEPFDPLDWGKAFVEGSAYQFRFAVPHDLDGLVAAFGGGDAFIAAWQEMVDTPPRFGVGRYGKQQHEMAEMASVDVGQYAQSNQPSHAFAWLPALIGRGELTDALVKQVCDELYTPDLFPGDEDNGEMASWYVLAKLGLYSTCPGKPGYALTQPSFESVVLRVDDGATLRWSGDQWRALIGRTRQATLEDLRALFAG